MGFNSDKKSVSKTHSLVVRRTIAAPAERLFNFWTQPEHMKAWWGPADVTCIGVEIDLKIGGSYRIGNLLPDGNTLWITGHFEEIDRPSKLVYTWQIESNKNASPERVEVNFLAIDDKATEVIIKHNLIVDEAVKKSHLNGWLGCIEGLILYCE